MNSKSQKEIEKITRKEALNKLGNYGKYAALTSLGTFLLLNPRAAQASSLPTKPGGGGF